MKILTNTKKIVTGGLLLGLLATSGYAKASKTVSLGAANLNFGDSSSTIALVNFGVEDKFSGDLKDHGYLFDGTLGMGSDFNVIGADIGYVYGLTKNIDLAAVVGMTVVGDENSSYVGTTYGARASYKINESHAFVLGYKTGSLEDDTATITVDADYTSFSYKFTFGAR